MKINNALYNKINEELSSLIINKSNGKPGDFSQMYYEGTIKALKEFPIDDNIVAKNHWLAEKRVETKIHRDSEWWHGYSDGLDIISDILDNLLYENED